MPFKQRCEFGLWQIACFTPTRLTLEFRAPSARRLRVEALARLTLKLAYAAFCLYVFSQQPVGKDSLTALFLMLAPIPFASFLRRTAYGDNRFIPYRVELDAGTRMLHLHDSRPGRGGCIEVGFDALEAVFLQQSANVKAPPERIVFQLRSGESIRLPPHGLDAEALLVPVRTVLAAGAADHRAGRRDGRR